MSTTADLRTALTAFLTERRARLDTAANCCDEHATARDSERELLDELQELLDSFGEPLPAPMAEINEFNLEEALLAVAREIPSRDIEPPPGSWVRDRHGASHQRDPKGPDSPNGGGWGQPGCWYFGQWEAMWDARGPLELCGPWGTAL